MGACIGGGVAAVHEVLGTIREDWLADPKDTKSSELLVGRPDGVISRSGSCRSLSSVSQATTQHTAKGSIFQEAVNDSVGEYGGAVECRRRVSLARLNKGVRNLDEAREATRWM